VISLVTIAQARAHLSMDHTLDDTYIQGLIYAASQAVLNYVGEEGALGWTDTSGAFPSSSTGTGVDSSGSLGSVPEDVRHAVLLLIGDFYANREPTPTDPVDPQFGYAYLPRAVVALLWPYRLPGIGVPEEVLEIPAGDSSGSTSS
jgi:hypothetical protein